MAFPDFARAAVLCASFGALAALGTGACDDETESDDSDGKGPASSASGGAAGAGGAGGDGGDGGEGAACSDTPCELVAPQCGCPAGQSCQFNLSGVVECAPEGATEPGRLCAEDCTAGYQCNRFGSVSDPKICRRFCDTNDQCLSPGGKCVVTVGVGLPNLCTENCDPVTDTGCSVEDDLKCSIGQVQSPPSGLLTYCGGTGDKEPAEVCTSSVQCGHGYGCFGVGTSSDSYCLRYCWNPPSGSCPEATDACVSFQTPLIVGSVQYGACVPEELQ